MKTSLRLILALSILQLVMSTPCGATDIITIQAKYKKDTVSAPDPEYPVKARNMGQQGQGIYRLVVDGKTGTVSEVKVLKSTGHRLLDASAVMTFFNWKFNPGITYRDVAIRFQVTGWSRDLH